MRAIRAILACTALATLAERPSAQGSTAGSANRALHREEFTRVSSVREIADGRVLVTDAREKRVGVLDFAARTWRPLGRVGDGPAEYRSPRQLAPLCGDSTILIDSQARRWLLVVGDRLVGAYPGTTTDTRLTGLEPPIRGFDGNGHILATSPLWFKQPGFLRRAFDADSIVAIRYRVGAPTGDTIARLKGRGSGRNRVVRGGIEYHLYNPFGVEEQPVLFCDGTTAIVRSAPFRVEWVAPSGPRTVGPPLVQRGTPITEKEMEYAIARNWAIVPAPPLRPSDFVDWPATLPEFPNEAAFPMFDGNIAVRRLTSASDPIERISIIDRRGHLVREIALGEREKLAGVGRAHLYVVVRDEDDVERIARLRLPE